MIRKLSKKRAAQNYEYNKLRKIYLEEHPICEANCSNESTEIHHKKGRIGQLLTDVNFFMAVCPHCHRWIESHPLLSKALGYSLSRLEPS